MLAVMLFVGFCEFYSCNIRDSFMGMMEADGFHHTFCLWTYMAESSIMRHMHYA